MRSWDCSHGGTKSTEWSGATRTQPARKAVPLPVCAEKLSHRIVIAREMDHENTIPSGEDKSKVEIPAKFIMSAAQTPNTQPRMPVGKPEGCRQLQQLVVQPVQFVIRPGGKELDDLPVKLDPERVF